jgi:hypothetical protein
MPSLAATTTLTAATHGHSLAGLIPVAVIALVIVTAGYLTQCWLFPFTTCRHTTNTHASRCRFCQGTGMRLRVGRHLLNRLRDTRRQGR